MDIMRQWYKSTSRRILGLYQTATTSCLWLCDDIQLSQERYFQKTLCEKFVMPFIKKQTVSKELPDIKGRYPLGSPMIKISPMSLALIKHKYEVHLNGLTLFFGRLENLFL